MLFGHGTYVFGILFVTEIYPHFSQKLRAFVEIFEERYKKELDDWTGSLSIFNKKELENLVNKIFL